jgi:hypothetical protein
MILISKLYLVTRFVVIVLLITGTACTNLGKYKNFNPVESTQWKPLYSYASYDNKFPNLYYDCGNFKIATGYIPIESSVYAIGIIVPIIPFYQKNSLRTNTDKIEISIVLFGNITGASISNDALRLETDSDKITFKPESVKVSYGHSQERAYFDVIFDVQPHSLSGFTLYFPNAVGDCSIPSLVYKKEDIGMKLEMFTN